MKEARIIFNRTTLILISILMSCSDAVIQKREFPILKTIAPTPVDNIGVVFNAEIVLTGTSPISSYGFVWDTQDPTLPGASKIEVGTSINDVNFSATINNLLARNADYKVRAYAISGGKTVYGSTIEFKSNGSEHSPWTKEAVISLLPEEGALGYSDTHFGYIMFNSNALYRFNPSGNGITKLENSAASGYLGAVAMLGSEPYMSNPYGIFKFVGAHWESVTTSYGAGAPPDIRVGHGYDQGVYFFSYYQSISFNVSTAFGGSATPPVALVRGGTSYGATCYVIHSDNSIWAIDARSGPWVHETDFPGTVYDQVMAFTIGNKLYFGLSYRHYFVADEWMSRELWSYDLITKEWELQELLPTIPMPTFGYSPRDGVFHFSIGHKFYFGVKHSIPEEFTVWSFDTTIQ